MTTPGGVSLSIRLRAARPERALNVARLTAQHGAHAALGR